jgi:SAM-dependent methyltransferase
MSAKFVRHKAGYLRVDPLPSPEELAEYYSSDYYQNPHGTYSSEYTTLELEHKRVRNNFLYQVAGNEIDAKDGHNFLDVGCGEGFFLDTFFQQGWNVVGLDFSEFGVKKFNPHLLDFLVSGDIYDSLSDLVSRGLRFDCINLGNVLEHVLDPLSLLTKLKSLLGDTGTLLVTVPNDFSTLQVYLQENQLIDSPYWVAVPDHLNYFSHSSLRNLSIAAGLEPVDVLSDFPIEWFIANDVSNYSKDKLVGKAAHLARVRLDTLILTQNSFIDLKNFWSAMAKVGHGRVITLVARRVT